MRTSTEDNGVGNGTVDQMCQYCIVSHNNYIEICVELSVKQTVAVLPGEGLSAVEKIQLTGEDDGEMSAWNNGKMDNTTENINALA